MENLKKDKNIFIVSGSACSGKNTYIEQNKREGDLVWDFDKIHTALTGLGSHQHIEEVRKYIFSMRKQFYKDLKTEKKLRVWIINSSPLKKVRENLARELDADIIFLNRSQEECLKVAKNERPAEWENYVNSYFERLEAPTEDENIKIINVQTMENSNKRHIKRIIEDDSITIVYGKSEEWEGMENDTENETNNLGSEDEESVIRDHIPGHEDEIVDEIEDEEEEDLEDDTQNYNARAMKKINVWDEKHTQETRFFDVETRIDSKEGKDVVVGHAAVFNSLSEDLGGFREIIMPGAFDDILGDDTRAYFNHDPNFLLGRVSAGTLRLSVDDKGLRYELDIPKTTAGQDLKENLRNGNITQSSFAFTLPSENGDTWERDADGKDIRMINKIDRLWDVSPVSLPAYTSANDLALAHRSFFTSKENKRKQKEKNYELNLLNLKINLLKIKR